jgi:hypothetical protein
MTEAVAAAAPQGAASSTRRTRRERVARSQAIATTIGAPDFRTRWTR